MFAALLATSVWTLSSLASAGASRHLGGISANLLRLVFALPLLLLFSLVLATSPWQSLSLAGSEWFVWSGIIGMGVCDILMLSAYARLGARVTTLVVNTCAAPLAALIGWGALGEHPTWLQAGFMLVIVASVSVVLRPRASDRLEIIGLLCALGSAVAFASASVMSRIGFLHASAAGTPIHWLDSTIVRVTAGVALCLVVFAVAGWFARVWRDGPGCWSQAMPWLMLNAVLGPVIGLCCYQWALSTATAAEVHAIVAILPVLVLITTWMFGEERPSPLKLVGTVCAVAGVIGLGLSRA